MFFVSYNAHTFVAKDTGSLTSVQLYAHRLLSGEDELELEPPIEEAGGGAMSGCREAVEITTRNPKKGGDNRFSLE